MSDEAPEVAHKSLVELLTPLNDIPEAQRSYACKALLSCLEHHTACATYLQNRKSPEDETLAEQDTALLQFLQSFISGIRGVPVVLRYDLLESSIVASGMLEPFAKASPTGAISLGIPSNLGPDIVCDTISELVRAACTAVVGLFMYLNFPQEPESFPPAELVLIFATLVISSIVDGANAAKLDAAVQELGVAITTADIRWLMHYLRARIFGSLADVQRLLQNRDEFVRNLSLQQRDYLHMIKVAPADPTAYSYYAECCLQFQQSKAAAPFLERGVNKCTEANDDLHKAVLQLQLAMALLLGGRNGTFAADEIKQLQAESRAASLAAQAWLPDEWHEYAAWDGERQTVEGQLLPKVEEREGGKLVVGRTYEALKAMYMLPPPKDIPAGALMLDSSEPGAEGDNVTEG